jgi:excisionase family DNA binding protein
MQPPPIVAYSVPEAMLALGLCRDSIYKLIKQRKLVARKVGKRTLILAEDLQAFTKALPKIGEPGAAA